LANDNFILLSTQAEAKSKGENVEGLEKVEQENLNGQYKLIYDEVSVTSDVIVAKLTGRRPEGLRIVETAKLPLSSLWKC
jgi:hypothetical protein